MPPPPASPSPSSELAFDEEVAPSYPALEAFVETASRGEAAALFESLKARLAALPPVRAEHAKKVQKALGEVDALLALLLDTRERLAADLKVAK